MEKTAYLTMELAARLTAFLAIRPGSGKALAGAMRWSARLPCLSSSVVQVALCGIGGNAGACPPPAAAVGRTVGRLRSAIAVVCVAAQLGAPAAVMAQTAEPLAAPAAARQQSAPVREAVEQFLHDQSVGLPGKISISVGTIDPRLNLAACAALLPFLPSGSRAWGKTSVGVRCNVPSPWVIYVGATVRVQGDYWSASAPMSQGQTITQNDIMKSQGDLTSLPAGIITDPAQAIGRTLTRSVQAGAPLRIDGMKMQQAVQQGQMVRVISNGPGFSVSTEGRALANASEGQMVQARTASGQVVSGLASMGGIITVNY
ncbi:MAG: flagellar basal body P-ring formation chaperone FlgA [Janthinobacterium lividum]